MCTAAVCLQFTSTGFVIFVMPLASSFFAVAAPAKSFDQAAIECTELPATLDTFPLGSFVVGDAAYTLSDKCITPLHCLTMAESYKRYI